MVKLKFINLTHTIGMASVVVFAVLIGLIMAPPAYNLASAEEITTAEATQYSAAVNPVLSIALDKQVQVEFNPTASGDFKNSSANLSVSTNNTTGYRIMLVASDGNALKNTDGSSTIPSITNTVSVADFPKDTWGYNLLRAGEDISTYVAIPSTNTEAKKVETGEITAGLTDQYVLNFGTKVSSATPAGVYNKELVVSVVANPAELRTITDITTMQEINTKVCTNTPVGTETQLKDTRDNKWYWVSKLADGNCWMVQNLDLDIPATITTEFANLSDNMSTSWKPSASTIKDNNFNVGTDANSSYSWDVGEYRLLNTNTSGCSVTSGANIVTACGDKIVATANLQGDTIPSDVQNNSNLHYTLGNYYQWTTATAGTELNSSTHSAVGSICPQGWGLPTESDNRSLSNLTNTYGAHHQEDGSVEILTTQPLYFVRSGYINLNDNFKELYTLNNYGGYWSDTGGSSSTETDLNDTGYALFFRSTNYIGFGFNSRSFGFTVRCVVR